LYRKSAACAYHINVKGTVAPVQDKLKEVLFGSVVLGKVPLGPGITTVSVLNHLLAVSLDRHVSSLSDDSTGVDTTVGLAGIGHAMH
jgi:hypothetical protein